MSKLLVSLFLGLAALAGVYASAAMIVTGTAGEFVSVETGVKQHASARRAAVDRSKVVPDIAFYRAHRQYRDLDSTCPAAVDIVPSTRKHLSHVAMK